MKIIQMILLGVIVCGCAEAGMIIFGFTLASVNQICWHTSEHNLDASKPDAAELR